MHIQQPRHIQSLLRPADSRSVPGCNSAAIAGFLFSHGSTRPSRLSKLPETTLPRRRQNPTFLLGVAGELTSPVFKVHSINRHENNVPHQKWAPLFLLACVETVCTGMAGNWAACAAHLSTMSSFIPGHRKKAVAVACPGQLQH